MRIGNQAYDDPRSLAPIIPVFPLAGALLLPRGQLPLNIFEPRYVAMVDAALAGDRMIGMVQPRLGAAAPPVADLAPIGCTGRITSFAETGDGRYMITLTGIARFRIVEEVTEGTLFRCCRVTAEDFCGDFEPSAGESEVDRKRLLDTFRAYLKARDMKADWTTVDQASNETLVNALAMMSPYGPAEKQALLEAPDLKSRAETLIAITEMSLAREPGGKVPLQ
jgi:Lon protease-like protein